MLYLLQLQYHLLRGSGNTVLTANPNFRLPTETTDTPFTDHQEIWHRWLLRRPLPLFQIWCKSVYGGFWANAWNITKILLFIFIPFFGNSFTQECDFRGFRWYSAHLGGKIVQNSNYWGMNRLSQTCQILKLSHYGNYCIVATKFCIVIKITK